MAKQYEPWVVQLIDDLWNTCYPGVPRNGNASKSKCESLLSEIDHHLSLQSLFNYANERSSPPSDASLNIMSYYILRKWKTQNPDKFEDLQLDFINSQLNRNDIAKGDYLKSYRLIKDKESDTVQENGLRNPANRKNPAKQNHSNNAVKLPRQLSRKVYLVAGFCSFAILAILVFLINQYTISEDLTQNLSANRQSILSVLNDLQGISILHVFMILLLLFVIFYTPFGGKQKQNADQPIMVQQALRQFNVGWIAIWLSWLFLYTWMSFVWSQEIHFLQAEDYDSYLKFHTIGWSIADIFNILSTIFVFYIFLVMDMESLSNAQAPNRNKKFQGSLMMILLMSTTILLFSILDRFLYFGSWDDKIGPLLLSLLTAISLMYFFGRLDSHFFKAKREALAPLYLYAGIQVIWVELSDANSIIYAIFFTALLLKLYLFLVVKHWLQNGNFEQYFRRMFDIHQEQ